MDTMKEIYRILPDNIGREIRSILSSRVGGDGGLGEVRLKRGGTCSIVHYGEELPLISKVGDGELNDIFRRASHGSLYAYRETIAEGYVAVEGGIRLGISGKVAYDGGSPVGFSDIRALTFRVPLDYCDFEERLTSLCLPRLKGGILIYSPPGVGKTTALRALSAVISRKMRLVIVDERGEFETDSAKDAVILSGYKKPLGIEIATRNHSPEILMIDEICYRDVEALLMSLSCGVPIIASTHAATLSELAKKKAIAPLIDASVFSTFIEIRRKGREYSLKKYTLAALNKERKKATEPLWETRARSNKRANAASEQSESSEGVCTTWEDRDTSTLVLINGD